MKFRYILVLLFLTVYAQAQDNTPKESLEKGQRLFGEGQYEQALDIFSSALESVGNKQDTIVGLLYGWKGKALYYLQRDLEAFAPFQKAIEIYSNLAPSSQELAKFHVNIAGLYRWQYRHHKAIQHLAKALEITQRSPNDRIFSVLYTELGANYSRLGDFAKGLEFQELAVQLAKQTFSEGSIYYLAALVEKGILLNELKDYRKARATLKEALEALDPTNPTDEATSLRTTILQAMAFSHFQQNDWKKAMDYYLKLEEAAQNQQDQMSNFINLSSIAVNQNELDKANNYDQQAAQIAYKTLPAKSIDFATYLQSKARLELAKGNYDSALVYHQREIIALVDAYDNLDVYNLPELTSVNQTLSIDKLTDAISLKAQAFYKAYKRTKNQKQLEAALNHINQSDQLVNLMRKEYTSKGTKLFWSDLMTDAFETGIEICLELNKITKKEDYLHQAFYFSEKNKALLLLESFQNSRAMESSDIPAEILEQERELKLEIAKTEQEIQQLIEEQQEVTTTLKKHLSELNQAYQELIQQIEREHPKYHKAKYVSSFSTVEDIRRVLDDKQTLVEYFVGDSSTFIFKISQQAFLVKQIKHGFKKIAFDAERIVTHTTKFFQSRTLPEEDQSKWAKQHSALLFQFYKHFVQPVEPLSERVIIIPSGALAELPFSSFISEQPKDPEDFQTYKYLLDDYAFSYAYSATSLVEFCDKAPSKAAHSFLGFAPSFGTGEVDLTRGNRFKLSPLVYNSKEIKELHRLLGEGTIFLGEEATEQKFHELAPEYRFLHFSTHGLANRISPDYSMLIFAPISDSIENEYLYVRELYNTKLDADMVVLSACETGIGKLHRGEGVASLARGFAYAGTKSIFTTLWVVNDLSTYQIASDFYENLQKKMPKDVALQQAKKHFLKNNNATTKHPFFWAPYIIIGDSVPVDMPQTSSWYYGIAAGLAAGLVVLLFGIWIFRLKKRKAEA